MLFLKQSTASQEVLLGPFVDSTDGVTAETGLTIANTDIKVWKAGATTLANKNSGGATHISAGNYYAVLDATDTNTVGSGAIVVQMSGALAVRHAFTVLPANVYDSIVGGTDNLQVDTTQVGGTSQTARDLGASVLLSSGTGTGQVSITSGVVASNVTQLNGSSANLLNQSAAASTIIRGTVDTGSFTATATAFEADDITEATADHYNGRLILFTSGVLLGQAARVNDYSLEGSNGRFTVSTMTEAPGNNDQFVVV